MNVRSTSGRRARRRVTGGAGHRVEGAATATEARVRCSVRSRAAWRPGRLLDPEGQARPGRPGVARSDHERSVDERAASATARDRRCGSRVEGAATAAEARVRCSVRSRAAWRPGRLLDPEGQARPGRPGGARSDRERSVEERTASATARHRRCGSRVEGAATAAEARVRCSVRSRAAWRPGRLLDPEGQARPGWPGVARSDHGRSVDERTASATARDRRCGSRVEGAATAAEARVRCSVRSRAAWRPGRLLDPEGQARPGWPGVARSDRGRSVDERAASATARDRRCGSRVEGAATAAEARVRCSVRSRAAWRPGRLLDPEGQARPGRPGGARSDRGRSVDERAASATARDRRCGSRVEGAATAAEARVRCSVRSGGAQPPVGVGASRRRSASRAVSPGCGSRW